MICRFAKQYSVPRDEHVAVDVRRSCVDGGRTIEYDVAYLFVRRNQGMVYGGVTAHAPGRGLRVRRNSNS